MSKKNTEIKGNQQKSRWRIYLKRFCYFFLIIFISLAMFLALVETLFEYTPPKVTNMEDVILQLGDIAEYDSYKRFGESWSKEEQGLTILHTKGDYFTTGYSSGKLVGHIAPLLEDALLERVHKIVGSDKVVWLLRKAGYVMYSDLQNYFPTTILQEVYGYSLAVPDKHPELGSAYFRALNYQAAHDTGHRVMENVLHLQGCTSFAAWGSSTANGNLILARNFDFEIGDIFDRFKMVHVVIPEQGIPFISIAWPGMSGVVSGVNQELLAVTINAGKSDHMKWKATPVTIVVRQILQEAKTIAEAVSILENSETYVSESFLIADGKTNEAIVVEKSPELLRVRKPEFFTDAITCANHFFSPDFSHHENHQLFVKEGSSPKRLERIQELMKQSFGAITPQVAANILRDNKLARNIDIGMSHLHTINPSICSHSIIMDLSEGILWVNKGPNQSGEYLAISIKEAFVQEPQNSFLATSKMIDADEKISPEKIKEILQWRDLIERWEQQKYTEKEFASLVKNLQTLNKDHFLTMVATGDWSFSQKKYEEAIQWWEKALANHPYGEWIPQIQKKIQGEQ